MDAAHHDMVLAITSHIPHLVAYNIVGTVADLEAHTKSEVIKFSASGFRDFTRIAASDPVMWRDVFLTNREAVLEMLGRFLEDLSKLQRMVRVGDGPGMEALFTRTRKVRRSIITAGQETAAPDFGRPHGDVATLSGPSGTAELDGAPAPLVDINVEPDNPVREHGGGDDA
jgi:cyclohexadieny/prephenate dehydrogenase